MQNAGRIEDWSVGVVLPRLTPKARSENHPGMKSLLIALTLVCACLLSPLHAADDYVPGPDSKSQDGVPKGKVTQYEFTDSQVFPGTFREYWVYVPAGHDNSKPSPVMIFQDGIQYQAPNVFDNLIARKEIPSMVGVFVMHGRVRAASTNALDRYNRSYEYDGLGDNYARFLLDELLPHIVKEQGLNLSTNGNDRAIAGSSSGGICAFNAAWERPDAFRRVFTSVGTYVGLRGAEGLATLVRKTEAKPIRFFLQDGSNDQNIYAGDWWMENQMMERALVFSGYDVNHAWGDGGHNGKHATAVFPEALRWLWRDYPAEIKANPEGKSKQPVAKLVGDSHWERVGSGYRFTEGPAANAKGEVYFTDIPNSRIHRIAADGTVSVFAEDTGRANGLMFGPEGRLYACASGRKQIVAYDESGKSSVIAEGIDGNDLAITQSGDLYVTEPPTKQVWLVRKDGTKQVVDKSVPSPNGVLLSPDQTLLYVADYSGRFVYSFQIQPDGSLAYGQRYFYLHLVDGSTRSAADGMTVDTNGNLYVATEMGIQFCDPPGRVNGILSKPQPGVVANVCFGGPDFDVLYATCGDKVFKRKLNAKGVRSADAAIKPPKPGL
jgi:gluconolactonase